MAHISALVRPNHGIAVALAQGSERLATLRAGLRQRMRSSPLCDACGLTWVLENTYRELWWRRYARQPQQSGADLP